MKCQWCEQDHGPICPHVKAIEYHPDGTLKRVEFMTFADRWLMAAPLPPSTLPPPPYYDHTPFKVYTTCDTGHNTAAANRELALCSQP